MQKLRLTFFFSFLLLGYTTWAQSSLIIKEYIAKYSQIAIEEMKRTGVPASITLAQGIHETEAGRSKLVLQSNNHFGIKCKNDWKGETVYHNDDARGECFRKYDSPFDSYRDHSDFLKNRSHYAFLFNLDPTDYEAWAYGLKKAGYATNPKYPQLLIKLIQDYNLQEYTLVALGKKEIPQSAEVITVVNTQKETAPKIGYEVSEKIPTYPQGVFKINHTKAILVSRGTPYLSVAQQYNIPLARLFEFNDMQPLEEAIKEHLLFLQRKRKAGEKEFHVVEAGESLHDIAQKEGVRLENLMENNWLAEGLQPLPGETLYLQKKAPKAPKMVSDQLVSTTPQTPSPINVIEGSVGMVTLHIVQPKETFYSLAKKYGVSIEEIKASNGLVTDELKAGQQLHINTKNNVSH